MGSAKIFLMLSFRDYLTNWILGGGLLNRYQELPLPASLGQDYLNSRNFDFCKAVISVGSEKT